MKYVILTILLIGVGATAAIAFQSPQTSQDYVISGQVIDESGQPVANARVCAQPSDYDVVRQQSCSRSKANGDFVIAAGRPASYSIYSEKPESGYFPQVPFFQYPGHSVPVIVLNEAKKSARVIIKLPPKNGEFTGRSVDATTGQPIENVRFVFCHATDTTNCWGASAKNVAGEFKFHAPHVPFTLKAFSEGYEIWLGLHGDDLEQTLYVPSGTRVEMLFYLKRQLLNRPLSEDEKQVGVNLPAPEQISPDDDAQFNYYPRKTKLEWNPVSGATSYRLEIDYCQGRVKAPRTCVDPQPHHINGKSTEGIRATSYEFNFVGAQPGRWRVWAVDEKGQEGFKSPWRTFFYLQ